MSSLRLKIEVQVATKDHLRTKSFTPASVFAASYNFHEDLDWTEVAQILDSPGFGWQLGMEGIPRIYRPVTL